MKSPYQNPYYPIDLDDERSDFERSALEKSLIGDLIAIEPPCVSVMAERGMGGATFVKQLLSHYRNDLPFQIVEWDVKSHVVPGKTVVDFYRGLIRQLMDQVRNLPPRAYHVGTQFLQSPMQTMLEVQSDFVEFCEVVRDAKIRILMVFYYFDRLPGRFQFNDLDWMYLRNMNAQYKILYYLMASRRSVKYVERAHNLDRSLFAALFSSFYRIGLLDTNGARSLITEPAARVLGQNAWDEWLAERILEWGGRNPYCLRYICCRLFDRIWIQGERVGPSDAGQIAQELKEGLRPYFDRLIENLKDDGLYEPLLSAVKSGGREPRCNPIDELLDLGYFIPELLDCEPKAYVLFSPMFHDRVVELGDLPASLESELPPPLLPEVKATPIPSPNKISNVPLEEPLTSRELQALHLLASELSRKEIALELSVSEDTVKKFVGAIYRKLGVDKCKSDKRMAAVNRARQLGILNN